MDKNICRVFTFYSNFLPAVTEEHYWEYCAFGTIDGIDVGQNIAENGGEILDCIWREHTGFQKTLSGKYNAERIYGIRFGNTESEKEFWEENPEYPFLFFSRIQCEGNRIAFWSRNNRSKLEEKLSLDGRMKIMTYLTYGNSDLFLVAKAQSYQDGAQIIHTMNQGMNLILDSDLICYVKNSFTIMAIRHNWIDNMESLQRMKLNEKKIGCCVKIIKEPNEDSAKIVRAIKDKVKGIGVQRKAVLGADDEQIVIKNIGWGDFLSLYSRTDGIFCNSNLEYRTVWAGSTTMIQEDLFDIMKELRNMGFSFYGDTSMNEQELKRISDNSKSLRLQYISQKNDLMEKLKQVQESSGKDFKEISIILNSVPRYAGGLFNDYIFFSILPPLNFLLCLMQENLKMGTLNLRDYYDFLKSFCMYVQGSLTSDRHSIQAIDFNSKIYEVPVKIIAFYSAHINFVKRILSAFDDKEGNSCAYEFLVTPGISNVVYVDELYCRVSNQKRLMKVEIPEYCLYNLHDMMIILTHETAHYVGRRYRLRDEVRYDSILKSFSHIYVSYVRSWCLEEKVSQKVKDSAWELVQQRMETMLHRALDRKLDKDYVSRVENANKDYDYTYVIEKNKTYGKHMSQLQTNIHMAMIDIVQFSLKNIFGPVLYSQENLEELYFCIKQASERYIVVHESGSTLMSSRTTMEVLAMIYEEGFADLIAFLVLEMTAIEYVDGLLRDVERQGRKLEDCYKSDLLYRIGIVLQCYIGDEKLGKELIADLLDNKKVKTDVEQLIERALMTCEKNSRKPVEPDAYHKDLKNILRDDNVVDEVLCYLTHCRDKFHEDYKEPSQDMKMIRTIFKKYSNMKKESTKQEVSVEEQMLELMGIIWKSRDNVLYSN